MRRLMKILMLSVVTLGIMIGTLFIPKKVDSYEEIEAIPLGYPFPFWIQNMERITPDGFPREYRIGNPWEDPWHVVWSVFAASFAVVLCALLLIEKLFLLLINRLGQIVLKRRNKKY